MTPPEITATDTTTKPGAFQVRDVDLLGRPRLAVTGTYDEAVNAVTTLNEQLYDQLDANGEGGVGMCFRLVVVPVDNQGAAIGRACYTSSTGGMRPRPR